jgi:HD superfamily phosphohydrolase YqeK
MLIFVADGVEPLRRPSPGITQTRDMIGNASLEDVFWNAFVGGIVYVLDTGRYLYPGTIHVYNTIAQNRMARTNASECRKEV